MNHYQRGNSVIVQGTFTDQNGRLVDPVTQQIILRSPLGLVVTLTTTTTPPITPLSPGVWQCVLGTDAYGVYQLRWIGALADGGSVSAVDSFVVDRDTFPV